jgi:uncharacterized protein (TIGR00255 family)
MKSMTGYGASKLDSPTMKASIILKSWNSRFLDLSIQMPAYLGALERRIRELIESKVGRGKLELYIRVLGGDMPSNVVVDTSSAKAVADAVRSLAKAAGIDESLKISHLLGIEGMVSFERNVDADTVWNLLAPELVKCIDDFNEERTREGATTAADLDEKLLVLESALELVDMVAPELENTIRTSLRARFEEVMGSLVDEGRILGELSAYLARHTISEEITRLRSHIASFRTAMLEQACGKKLDFICQEMNREANTIGSKSADARIGDAVIRMKDSVENLREQIRNVE